MRLTLTSLVLATVGVSALAQEHPIEKACRDTVHAYAFHRDRLDDEAYANLFSVEGVFETPTQTYRGREELAGYIKEQPETIATTHHITTVRITSEDQTSARGDVYVMVMVADAQSKPRKIKQIASGLYQDEYEIDGSTCLIKSRKLIVLSVSNLVEKD